MADFHLSPAMEALVEGLHFEYLPRNDPRITICSDAYKEHFKLPKSAQPDGMKWRAVLHDNYLVAVLGEKMHPNGVLELTDFYMHPAAPKRLVVAACYGMLVFYKKLIDTHQVPRLATQVLYDNKEWQRALERVLGVKPRTLVYFSEVE